MNDSSLPQHPDYPPTLGALYQGDGCCQFRVWAPHASSLELKIVSPEERLLTMQRQEFGYYELTLDNIEPGTKYFYRLNGEHDRPDPASRFQPDGVHNASAVVDPEFPWTDQHWHGIPLHQYITYELHVGTYSPEGTFEGIIPYLNELVDLGVTAIELMPVAQFPGDRNWGYDGVHPFGIQNSYGGPEGLRRLVDAAHQKGLAVIMDVVYNHIGPEGNYLSEFGHYFTDRHHTPWGQALNFDGRHCDEVRRYFIENALHFISEYHIDALRLDAVHAIFDFSARPFLQELADAVRIEGERLNRHAFTIAESSLADPLLISPKELGGYGIDGQWCDDLHHAIRTELTDERGGYYADYRGFQDIVKAYTRGFVQEGGFSAYRGRRHGRPADHINPIKLVVCSQNHDQVGNRLFGERLTELVSFEQLKLAAGLVILSPFSPMLFMGEEYAETARFQFFTSFLDPGLVEAVRKGRKQEFIHFQWKEEPPDPQSEVTFQNSKLNHALKEQGPHRNLRDYYKRLIALRKNHPALAFPNRERMEVRELFTAKVMTVRSWAVTEEVLTIFNFEERATTVELKNPKGNWELILDSSAQEWNGPGNRLTYTLSGSLTMPPVSVLVFQNTHREHHE